MADDEAAMNLAVFDEHPIIKLWLSSRVFTVVVKFSLRLNGNTNHHMRIFFQDGDPREGLFLSLK